MPSISSLRFRWLPSAHAWQDMALWRERQKQHRENFEASANLASTAFETARTSLDSGMVAIAVKIASERIAANLQAKMKSVNKLA